MNDSSRIVDHKALSEDAANREIIERSLRPQTLDDFIGQAAGRENLKVFISAARQRKEAMDHVLFHGPPGLGKTTLAQIVARELGVSFRTTSGSVITKTGDLAAILTSVEPHDVLFIDEIHRLSASVEEVLYLAMEDFHMDVMIGEGPSARSVQIDLAPFTLIGATTRSGLITKPLRDRFGIPVRLNFYTPKELELIVMRNASLLRVDLTQAGAFEIARRSRGTPRVSGRLLRRIRDFAVVLGTSVIDERVVDEALTRLEVDHMGLDAMDLRYLSCIANLYEGGPVGIETLSAALSEPKDTIEDVLEPYLLQQGFIQRTSRGRILTKYALLHLGMTPVDLSSHEGNNKDLFNS